MKQIRALEEAHGIFSTDGAKIVMASALGDIQNLSAAFNGLCDAYFVKPIDKAKLLESLRKIGLC